MKPIVWLVIILAFYLAGCIAGIQTSPGVDPLMFPRPLKNAVTYWGHACCYIDINGVGFATDPVFDDSYSPFHRRKIPSPPCFAYGQTSIILISHAHRDHLSPRTLSKFPKTVTILCPAQSAEKLADLDMPIEVMDIGETYSFPGGVVVAVPAYHPGGRNSLKAKADGCALGYIIRTSNIILYYSGDTEYFGGLRDIGKTYRPDLALLNINRHLNSTDAVRAI